MRVVIVGAGLSGLSLAAFLRRLSIDCVVLEQAPFLNANYQNPVTLYANALSCFKAFDFGSFFDQFIVAPEDVFGIKNTSNDWLLKIRNSEVLLDSLREGQKVPSSTAPPANSESIVMRAVAEEQRLKLGSVPLRATVSASKLKLILRRFTPEIRYGCRVVGLVPHEGIKGGVHAVLEDGTMEWGDVIVGADGMHSTIRRLLYPNEYVTTTSKSLNMTTIDGFTDVSSIPPSLGEAPCEFWGLKKTVSYVPVFHDGESRISFSATLFESPQEIVNLDIGPMGGEQVRDAYRGVLAREFSDFPPELHELLKRADVAVPTEHLEVPIMPKWFNRRAVLIGEAAHGAIPCFLGQDSSLCVEDAAMLATALLDTPLQTDSGFEYTFKGFEVIRRMRIEKYVRQSRRARRFTASSHPVIRDTALRMTPPFMVKRLQTWLSQWAYNAQELELDPRIKAELRYRI